MLKKILIAFTLSFLSLLGNGWENYAAQPSQKTSDAPTGTLQKMIVESGSVTMDLDLNGLNGSSSLVARPVTLHFAAAANSFLPILVFNDLLRAAEAGSMTLIPQNTAGAGVNDPRSSTLSASLRASLGQLAIEKMDWDASVDLVVRDSKSGLVFFNVEGHQYDYVANALGRPADAGATVGKISIGAAMQPIEIKQMVNGQPQSAVLPPVQGAPGAPSLVPGPDVIVGLLSGLQQFGSDGTQIGLAVGTDSCNNGDQPLDWFSLPDNDHPVIPQNLYRMSGGANNDERFEQVGHSWLKHAFLALEDDACGFGCNTNGCVTGQHLCVGCSDPYGASLNASQTGLGSRAWVNPFTGFFPRGDSQTPPNNHTGHVHTGTSHRILVEVNDLNTTLNPGATYFAEAAYISPHEYAWCQTHHGQCNMYNNASYQQYHVSGTTNFTFTPVGGTVRMQPAINAWTGAAANQIEPAPGNDGTVGSAGFSSTPWTPDQTPDSLTWSTETFAENPNANAIRWGTLYNFRFDSDQPPRTTNATIGFFKTGSPITVQIQAPTPQGTPSPTPTP